MIEAYIALGVFSRTELSRMRCTDHPENIGKQNIYEHNLTKVRGRKILQYFLRLQVLRNLNGL